MRKAILGAALAALCGCSGGEDNDPQLEGTWAFTRADGCLVGLVLKAEDYETDIACRLQSGPIGVQAEIGMYTSSTRTLTFMPIASSCEGASAEPFDYGYELVGADTLRVASPAGALVLKRQKGTADDGPGDAIAFGCWGTGGSFTRGELRAL